MSYRNPQQVLDTQTGQAYRNLQASISNTFSKVADASIKEQAKLKKEKEARDKAAALQAAQSKKDQTAIAEQSVKSNTKFQKTINDSMFALKKGGMDIVSTSLDKKSELMIKGMQTTEDKVFVQNVEASYDAIENGITLWDSFISNTATSLGPNLGKPGGASRTGGERGRAFSMILNNFKKGKVDFEPKFDNPDGVEIMYTAKIEDEDDENYGKTYKMSYRELKDLQNGGGTMVPMIPDIYPSYKQSFNDANIVNDKKILQENFLGAVGPSEPDPKDPKKTRRFRTVDEKKVKAALYGDADVLISSMGESNPVGQFSLYNYYAEKQGTEQLPAGAILTTGKDSQTEKLTEMYVDDQYADLAGNFNPVLVSTANIENEDSGNGDESEPALTLQENASQLVDSFINNPVALVENSGIRVFDFDEETQKITVPKAKGGGKQILDLTKDSDIRRLISVTQGRQGLKGATIKEIKKLLTQKNLYSKYNKQGIEEAAKAKEDLKQTPIPYRAGYVPDYMQDSNATLKYNPVTGEFEPINKKG